MNKNAILPGQPTGYQHAKCYARGDNNCSTKISKEHFISANLLWQLEFKGTAKIAGLSWQEPEIFNKVPIDGLASNVLCERHNQALSPFDDAVGSLTDTIRNFDRITTSGAEHKAFSGSVIELWMLKCILGLSASGNIASTTKPECVDILFGRTAWPESWGLYFNDRLGGPIFHSNSLLVETLVGPDRLILAARFFVQGLPFNLCLGKPGDARGLGIFRPSEIVFTFPTFNKKLSLSWDQGSIGQPILLARSGTYDGPSPNWNEWQRNK